MRRLFLDIETLPASAEQHEILKMLFEKKEAKKKDKAEASEDFEQFLLGTSFDGAFGHILCIGFAVDREPADILNGDGNEKKMLQDFWAMVDSISIPSRNPNYPDYGVQFIGHNVMDFDLRFIYQRSIILGVKPAYDLNFARYRSYPIYDTQREWVKWANSSVGLEKLALALGVPTPKDGIDGSQVYDFYQAGKVNEILEYCKRDVEATRQVYNRMTFSQ